jgi:hypothetical protein
MPRFALAYGAIVADCNRNNSPSQSPLRKMRLFSQNTPV